MARRLSSGWTARVKGYVLKCLEGGVQSGFTAFISSAVRQGIFAEQEFRPAEKPAFFVGLRILAEHHGLPLSRAGIEVWTTCSPWICRSQVWGVRATPRRDKVIDGYAARDNLVKVRKVSVNSIFAPTYCELLD